MFLYIFIPSLQRWMGHSNAAVRGWLGQWVDAWVSACFRSSVALYLEDTITTNFSPNHFQNSHVSYGWWKGGTLLILGHEGQRSRVNCGTLCIRPCGQDTEYCFSQSLTILTCKLWMMGRRKSYWFWVIGSKVKVNFGTLCIRPFRHNTDYSLCPFHFKLHM